MPVIINEFEIVAEARSAEQPSTVTRGVELEEPPTTPEPSQIIRTQRIYWQRKRRLWAD